MCALIISAAHFVEQYNQIWFNTVNWDVMLNLCRAWNTVTSLKVIVPFVSAMVPLNAISRP